MSMCCQFCLHHILVRSATVVDCTYNKRPKIQIKKRGQITPLVVARKSHNITINKQHVTNGLFCIVQSMSEKNSAVPNRYFFMLY